ncbi:hypothetical protein J2W28_004809 [Variovorax boronicumulans]|nr:hypothetical protein [Variovorax boronicumulans]MDP9989748.1 hypothetical protein [Variovorax boronicumulans]MDQ0005644.1 hypothetical protein [Variovorax boronicumulans]
MTPEALLAHYDKAAPWPADGPARGPAELEVPFDSLAITLR